MEEINSLLDSSVLAAHRKKEFHGFYAYASYITRHKVYVEMDRIKKSDSKKIGQFIRRQTAQLNNYFSN